MPIAARVFAVLALLSLGTMLLKRPWTTAIARRHYPPQVWSTPLFLETNMVLTGAWALLFGTGAWLAAVAPGWVTLVFGALLLALGRASVPLGSWYSSRRLRSLAADQ